MCPGLTTFEYYVCILFSQVETIGDAYMVVSGAPEVTKYHALHTCDMALNMLESMSALRDPSTEGNMKIRVGQYCQR